MANQMQRVLLAKQKHLKEQQAHLRVISSSGKISAVWGKSRGGYIVVVALLLQNVALTAPLPDQQLSQGCAAQRNPVPSLAEGDGVDC